MAAHYKSEKGTEEGLRAFIYPVFCALHYISSLIRPLHFTFFFNNLELEFFRLAAEADT